MPEELVTEIIVPEGMMIELEEGKIKISKYPMLGSSQARIFRNEMIKATLKVIKNL